MRAAVLIACTLFIVALAGTTVAARLSPPRTAVERPDSAPAVATSPSPAPGAPASPTFTPAPTVSATVAAPAAAPGYTSADVAKHASPGDCWIIVGGRIYNVTSYLSTHPGGAETITPWCGKEATVAYETEDGAGTHSSRADRLLESYYLADLRR